MRQSVTPQLASWDRAEHPSQVGLARFLAHVDAIAGPVLATASGRVAAELIVGFSAGVPLIDGHLPPGDKPTRRTGQNTFRSTTLISLAAVLYDCGQPDEAARMAVEGEQIGAAEDVVNFAYSRALRARIAADQGAHHNADSLARQASNSPTRQTSQRAGDRT